MKVCFVVTIIALLFLFVKPQPINMTEIICHLPPFFDTECMHVHEMILMLRENERRKQHQPLFAISTESAFCAEGVDLHLLLDDEIIPCVKCPGNGDLQTDGHRLFCENQETSASATCLDQPTYFGIMLGDFSLCVRRAWWDDNPYYGGNVNRVNLHNPRYYSNLDFMKKFF